jgi:hypothetical protein
MNKTKLKPTEMDTIEIFEKYGVVLYGLVILFGGLAGINYLPNKWENKYKFLAFSTIFAIVFIAIEIIVQNNFKAEDATKYLFTYTTVAVAYQVLLKKLFVKWGLVKDDEAPKP